MRSMILILFACLLMPSYSLAGEITDTEWRYGRLYIRYAEANLNESKVSCTAFSPENKAIGGSFSYAWGGVAKVTIDVPKKYEGDDLHVSCRSN